MGDWRLLNLSKGFIRGFRTEIFAAGVLLGWNFTAAVVLGGVTWISSSGMIAKVLTELNRLQSPETPVVLSILVLEDLAMAVYLPLAAALLVVGGPAKVVLLVSIAIVTSLLSSAWPSAMDRRSAA